MHQQFSTRAPSAAVLAGVVYLAQDAEFRAIALKVCGPNWPAATISGGASPGRPRRHAKWPGSAARPCWTPGSRGETAYLVTEYVDGPDLASVIEARGPMSGANLEALAVGAATALAAIHEAGIMHRDLKPFNILLGTVGPCAGGRNVRHYSS